MHPLTIKCDRDHIENAGEAPFDLCIAGTDSALARDKCDGAVHRAGVDVAKAERTSEFARHSRLTRAHGTVDRDYRARPCHLSRSRICRPRSKSAVSSSESARSTARSNSSNDSRKSFRADTMASRLVRQISRHISADDAAMRVDQKTRVLIASPIS